MARRDRILLLSVGALFLALLILYWTVEVPIQTIFYDNINSQSDELIIFLPGIGDEMDIFEQEGFIDLLHKSRRSPDSVVVNAHLGYYWTGTLPKRVHDDVLLPFRERGYKKFIVVGVSLGGYGGLWLNDTFSEQIKGLVLFSPLLGRESLVEDIIAAGDIRSWRSQLDHTPGFEEQAWIWIDNIVDPEFAETGSLILAFGKNDKFQKAAELLARSVPDSHVFRNNGSHKWVTWLPLWSEITNSQSWYDLGNRIATPDSMDVTPSPEKKTAGL